MPPTVVVNKLTMCHQGSQGVAMATVPDVCNTPTGPTVTPLPYPNMAKDADLADGSTTVKADGESIAIKGCTFSTSTGDEAGSLGGVGSGTISGEAKFISFSPNVKVQGKAVARLSDKMTMNNENTVCMAGILIAPIITEPLQLAELKTIEKKDEVRNIKVHVLTARKNPVISVEATLTLEDNSKHTAISDKQGIALFENMPSDTAGTVTYENEEDLFAKSMAADLHAAIKGKHSNIMMRLLQSMADFAVVKSAYQENYGSDLGSSIKNAFNGAHERDVVQFLLIGNKLLSDSNKKIIEP